MSITNTEAIDLLTAASVYDSRKPNPDAVLAWMKASELGRWSFPEALNALHEHYATSRDYLMPAHITERIKARRAQPGRPELPPGSPAGRARVDDAIAEVAKNLGWKRPPDPDENRRVLAVRCPWCSAAPHEPCSRPTGRGGRLTGPHPARVEAAGRTA